MAWTSSSTKEDGKQSLTNTVAQVSFKVFVSKTVSTSISY